MSGQDWGMLAGALFVSVFGAVLLMIFIRKWWY